MRAVLSSSRLWWVSAAVLSLLLSGTVVFGITQDQIWPGERSALVDRFVTEQASSTSTSSAVEAWTAPRTFGEGDSSTLVLYDPRAEEHSGEIYGMAAGNLATHFGEVTLVPVDEYSAGQIEDYDLLIYVGSNYDEVIAPELVEDVVGGQTPVFWAGGNITELAGIEDQALEQRFVSTYGWNPLTSNETEDTAVTTVRYKGQDLERETHPGESYMLLPDIVDVGKVEVLATSVCEDPDDATACEGFEGSKEAPWAIRSGNLTYMADVPFNYMSSTSMDLVFADLLYPALGPDIEPVQRAAVRFEDVGPEADPEDLRGVADYLSSEGVPFQVAVVPVHIAKVPGSDPARWYGLSLLDRPEVVEALKYMEERGGTLIQHGTTHQYGDLDNPYDGASGADYEFYASNCSDKAEWPYKYEECERSSFVQLVGPVPEDSVAAHRKRIAYGRKVMVEAGLTEPTIFETPHYAASVNAYRAMDEEYGQRYERGEYFASVLEETPSDDLTSFTQGFPYTVHDIYGSKVIPENLENVSIVEQNGNEKRPPSTIIAGAEAHLVVRESTASFFFHPFLDIDLLKETVTGIKDLGYTFVPATELP